MSGFFLNDGRRFLSMLLSLFLPENDANARKYYFDMEFGLRPTFQRSHSITCPSASASVGVRPSISKLCLVWGQRKKMYFSFIFIFLSLGRVFEGLVTLTKQKLVQWRMSL